MPFREYLKVNNCAVGQWGVIVTGVGDLIIDNCNFYTDDMPYNSELGFIRSRDNPSGFVDGNLFVSNTTFTANTLNVTFLIAHMWTSGQRMPVGSPINEQFFNNITLDNIVVRSSGQINICPKIQQGSGTKFPSKVSYSNVTGANLIFTESDLQNIAPPSSTSFASINNPTRMIPNVHISLNDVTLTDTGISLRQQGVQTFCIDLDINNLRCSNAASVYPSIELVYGGSATINGSNIEGLDFFLGTALDKPLFVSLNGCMIKHTGLYNAATILNGYNGFSHVVINNTVVSSGTQQKLSTASQAILTGCKYFLNDSGGAVMQLCQDVGGVAGTYALYTPSPNSGNRAALYVGTGTPQVVAFNLPSPGGSVYVPVTASTGVSVAISADGASITFTLTGSPYVRHVAIV
ncbi:hypothetical protein OHZ45_003878 [Escherichia coli]|nr:hypothetical protein [Escherichia coli]EJZ1815519.1 hypothetical protein [Escherichia coli]